MVVHPALLTEREKKDQKNPTQSIPNFHQSSFPLKTGKLFAQLIIKIFSVCQNECRAKIKEKIRREERAKRKIKRINGIKMRGERGKRITDEVYVCVRVVFSFGKSPTLEFSHHNFNGSDRKMPKRKTKL